MQSAQFLLLPHVSYRPRRYHHIQPLEMNKVPAASELRLLLQSTCRRGGTRQGTCNTLVVSRSSWLRLRDTAETVGFHLRQSLEDVVRRRYVELLIDNDRVFRCRSGAHINASTSAHL